MSPSSIICLDFQACTKPQILPSSPAQSSLQNPKLCACLNLGSQNRSIYKAENPSLPTSFLFPFSNSLLFHSKGLLIWEGISALTSQLRSLSSQRAACWACGRVERKSQLYMKLRCPSSRQPFHSIHLMTQKIT